MKKLESLPNNSFLPVSRYSLLIVLTLATLSTACHSETPHHHELEFGQSRRFAAPSTGQLNVGVLMIRYADAPNPPVLTPAAMQEGMFGTTPPNRWSSDIGSLREYYLENSYGQLDINGQVHGWWTVTSTFTCNQLQWINTARAYAPSQGVNLDNYDVLVYYIEEDRCTTGGGVATTDGYMVWNLDRWDALVHTHEMGHALGLNHANYLDCDDVPMRADLSQCSTLEYYDEASTMGGRGHFNVVEKERLGWLSSDLVTVNQAGSYTLEPLSAASSTVKGLKIPLNSPLAPSQPLWLQFRQPQGWDDYFFHDQGNWYRGVSIHTSMIHASVEKSQLIDTHPAGGTGTYERLDPALELNESWQTPSGITIRVTSLTSTHATVEISKCGDGVCSPGESNSSCAGDCPICGDGVVTGSEECDDGNLVSGDGCANDCTIEAPPLGPSQCPWRDNGLGSPIGPYNWHYSMGYHFTPQVDGQIRALGAYVTGTKTVRLYDYNSGTLLAETTVSATGGWAYTAIAGVTVHAGQRYTVAVDVAGRDGYAQRLTQAFPRTHGDILIHGSTFTHSGRPTNLYTRMMLGMADIDFAPFLP